MQEEVQHDPIRLGTMGMFIIDTFQFIDPTDGRDLGNRGLEEQMGGGGCYFAIGARMWLAPKQIQMIVDRGCDWKRHHQSVLDCYDHTPVGPSSRSMWHFRERPDETTRALNRYTGDQRGFMYLSPKIRLDPIDLLQCSPLRPSRLPEWIHLVCSPERALDAYADMHSRCTSSAQPFPSIVYEPIPDSCIPENLDDCIRSLELVTVFSPNHEEAASLLGLMPQWEAKLKTTSRHTENELLDFIKHELAAEFLRLWVEQYGVGESSETGFGPIICIRSGAWGSIVGRGGIGFVRVPAWHSCTADSVTGDFSSDKIVDVTGAGNAFLGGLTAYLIKTDEKALPSDLVGLKQAALHGAVSASLVIEQLGLPEYCVADGAELWNSRTAVSRLDSLQNRS